MNNDTTYKFSNDVLQLTIQSKNVTEICKVAKSVLIPGYELIKKGNIKQKITNNKEMFYCTLVFDKGDIFEKYARRAINKNIKERDKHYGRGVIKVED